MTRGSEERQVDTTGDRLLGEHIRRAHEIRGEHQIPEYVFSLSPQECVEILEASPVKLSSLVARSQVCRVSESERRDFPEVIRWWTIYVLSGLEGG